MFSKSFLVGFATITGVQVGLYALARTYSIPITLGTTCLVNSGLLVGTIVYAFLIKKTELVINVETSSKRYSWIFNEKKHQ